MNSSPPNDPVADFIDAELVHRASGPRDLWLDWSYQFLMLLATFAVLVMSFLMKLSGDGLVFLPGAAMPLPDACVSRMWFGIDCPGCGLTRSFLAMSRGEWTLAFRFNLGGPLLYCLFWAQLPWRGFQLWRLCRGKLPFYSVWLFVGFGVVLSLLVGQWIWKLAS